MKGGLIQRALNKISNLFQRKQETDHRPGQRTIQALRSEVLAQHQRFADQYEEQQFIHGHRVKGRRVGRTKCRCFVRAQGTPFCRTHKKEVWCKKHRHYICLDCGNRDRISGVR